MRKSWALIFFIGLLLLFLLTLLLVFYQQKSALRIPSNAYLEVRLQGPVPEYWYGFGYGSVVTLADLFQALKAARNDSRIKKVFFFFRYSTTGWAGAQQLRNLIQALRKKGKETIAFIEIGNDLDYYIATSCDKIYVFPSSYIELNGIASLRFYYKDFLEKIGIKAEIYHIGKYKTAAYPYKKRKMTPYEREEIKKIGSQIMEELINVISSSRKLSREEVLSLMNEKGIFLGEDLRNSPLIDGVVTKEELEEKELKGLRKVELSKYIKTLYPKGNGKIAVVFAVGTISVGSNGIDFLSGQIIGSDDMVKILNKIKRDRSIKAVVLRVDSPGGSAIASEAINRAVRKLAEEKPVIVSMGNYAASGGYYISVGATKILAEPLTITGSIGVLGGKLSVKGLLEKVGINVDFETFTETALIDSPYKSYSAKEWQILQREIQSFYKLFLKRVAEGRGKKPEDVDKIARGRIWTGQDALKLGLIDKIGGLEEAIEEAAREAGVKRPFLEFFPKRPTFLEWMKKFFQLRVSSIYGKARFVQIPVPNSLRHLLILRKSGVYFLPLYLPLYQ